MTPGLVEPLPCDLRRGLRTLVFELLATRRVRRFPATLSVGVPGGERVVWPLEPIHPDDDPALRTEIVGALLLRVRELTDTPCCWLTRPGEPDWHDLDAAWLAPAVAAFAEAGVSPVWVVVTRRAWWDPRSDLRRTWKRPRSRSRPRGGAHQAQDRWT